MTIAYLASEYPKRSHTFIRREISEMRDRGLNIKVVSIRRPDKSELLCQQDWDDYNDTWSILPISVFSIASIHIRSLLSSPLLYISTFIKALKHRNPGAKNLLWSIFHFVEAIILSSKIKSENITHLHTHFANVGATIGYLTSSFTGCSWSLTLHGSADFDFPAGTLLSDKLKTVKFANCVSSYGRSQLYRSIPIDYWHKIFISRCGIEIEAIPDHHPTGKNTRFTLGCVGRLSAEKGHLGLIEACHQLVNQNKDIRLVLIGDGPERQLLEKKVKELNLEERIEFKGFVSEEAVIEHLKEIDLFVLPSLMEGIPLVLMEAMAMHIPVVAPRLAGIPELIEDNQNGLMYTPSDWQDLADKVIYLIENPDVARNLALKGRQKVLEEFTIKNSVEPLWNKFQELEKL